MRRRVGIVLLMLLGLGLVSLRERAATTRSTSARKSIASARLTTDDRAQASPQKSSTGTAPAITDSPSASPEPDARDLYAPIAQAACQSATLSALTQSPEHCTQQVTQLKTQIENRITALTHNGIQLDRESCTATDPNGASTSLDSITEDLVAVTRQVLIEKALNASAFSSNSSAPGGDSTESKNYAFKRANMVAICSVAKSLDYWARHPQEIPPSDRIEDYLFFDTHEGKPKESFVAGSLLRAISGMIGAG